MSAFPGQSSLHVLNLFFYFCRCDQVFGLLLSFHEKLVGDAQRAQENDGLSVEVALTPFADSNGIQYAA